MKVLFYSCFDVPDKTRATCQTMAAAQAVRPQYTPEKRNFLFVEYVKNKGPRHGEQSLC